MSSTNHWSPSAPQGCVVGALVVGGIFLLACGFGMASVAVAVLGVAIAVLGPLLVMTIGLRNGGKDFVYGTAHVHEVSAPPGTGTVGRCELEVVVEAKGMNAVPVRLRDHAVPVSKWPAVGHALPVMVAAGDPRQVRILWDEIPSHRAAGPSAAATADPTAPDGDLDPSGDAYEQGEFDHEPQDGDEADPLFGFGDVSTDGQEDDLPSADPIPPADPAQSADPTSQPDSTSLDAATSASVAPTEAPEAMPQSSLPSTAVIDVPQLPRARRPQPYPARVPVEASGTQAPPSPPAESPFPGEVTPGTEATPSTESVDSDLPATLAAPGGDTSGVSVTLIVSDLDRSREFYRDTLGLSEIDTSRSTAVLAFGAARVILRQVTDMPPIDRRLVHLNLDVPDVQEAYDRMRERGVEFVHRPRVVQQGEHLELCSATFRDPDGHAIALTRWSVRR